MPRPEPAGPSSAPGPSPDGHYLPAALRAYRTASSGPLYHDYFSREARPERWAGREGAATFVYLGGLSATAWPWKQAALRLHAAYGFETRLYSLDGYESSWEHAARACARSWTGAFVDRLVEAKSRGGPVVALGFSTGAAVALTAAAARPDLVDGVVAVGTPYRFRARGSCLLLAAAGTADAVTGGAVAKLVAGRTMRLKEGPEGSDPDGLVTLQPLLREVPYSSLVALARLRRGLRDALPRVRCPVLFAYGEQDTYLDDRGAAYLACRVGSGDAETIRFRDATHPVMLGRRRDDFTALLSRWSAERFL